MIDLLLLAVFSWCTVWVSARGVDKALLYCGGVTASGYLATEMSGWFLRTFTPPSSPVLRWLSGQVAAQPPNETAVAALLPAEPAGGFGSISHQWMAWALLHSMLLVGLTVAVFALFLLMASLSAALWDHPSSGRQARRTVLSTTLAVGCGAYATVLVGLTIVDVSWLHALSALPGLLQQSMGVAGISHLMQWMRTVRL